MPDRLTTLKSAYVRRFEQKDTELAAQRALLAEAAVVLKPFAAWEHFDASWPDDELRDISVTVGDLRRAAALLNKLPKQP